MQTRFLQVVSGFAIFFACLGLGEVIVYLSHSPIPSSIIGMLILVAGLRLKWIPIEAVKDAGLGMVALLPLWFVVPGVAIFPHLPFLLEWFWPVSISLILSTVLVLITSGHVHQFLRKASRSASKNTSD